MSADTMPCGCLGHADYEDLCRYPALLAELEQEREARKRAEAERDEAREALKRSSGERHEEWRAKIDAVAARERAEASNAALLDLARDLIRYAPDDSRCLIGPRADAAAQRWAHATHGRWERIARDDHPGAALADLAHAVRQYQHRDETTLMETFRRLMDERARIVNMLAPEYVRALEKVYAAASSYLHEMHTVGVADDAAVSDACAAVDALRGKP